MSKMSEIEGFHSIPISLIPPAMQEAVITHTVIILQKIISIPYVATKHSVLNASQKK